LTWSIGHDPAGVQLSGIRSPIGLVAGLRRRLASIEQALEAMHERTRVTHDDVAALRAQADRLENLVNGLADEQTTGGIEALVNRLAADHRADRERWAAERAHLLQVLRYINATEPEHRRRLREARRSDAYALAFSDPDPLVSIVIPTYDNHELLRERAIPSALAQTHENFELIIVGDDAPPEAEEVALSFSDPRISYRNLTQRGPYPEDPQLRWYVAGSQPANEAFADARGRWIAPMADDDAMHADHIAVLLERARRDRLELVYGRFMIHLPDAEPIVRGEFPPRLGQVALQAALQHAELRFFELELTDSLFELPTDWAKVERMLRVGVRFGMVDDVVVDVYPSTYWNTQR
jgi:hypothetical protein